MHIACDRKMQSELLLYVRKFCLLLSNYVASRFQWQQVVLTPIEWCTCSFVAVVNACCIYLEKALEKDEEKQKKGTSPTVENHVDTEKESKTSVPVNALYSSCCSRGSMHRTTDDKSLNFRRSKTIFSANRLLSLAS